MKIQNIFNNVLFGKSLVAKCSVFHKEKGSIPCSIFQLSESEDSDYFEKINNKSDWQNARYLNYLISDLKSLANAPYSSIYSLETCSGDCLAYSEIEESSNEAYEILLLETAPKLISKNTKNVSPYKYIGETFVAFLAKKSMNEKKTHLDVVPAVRAENFYTHNCFFKKSKNSEEPFYLKRSKFKKLINQNVEHTKSHIRFVG